MEVMSFRDYWKILDPQGKQDFSTKMFCSQSYLSQVANGHRTPSRRLVELACIVSGKTLEFPGCCSED